MSDAATFLCLPKDFKQKFLIYPPTVKQVVGNPKFNQYRALLTLSQEELEDVFIKNNKQKGFNDYDKFKVPTPFEYFMANSYHNKEVEEIAKEAFYFFTKQTISFLYEEGLILIGDLEDELKRVGKHLDALVFLTADEFFEFQNAIRESLGEDKIEPPDPTLHPKIRRMKALARYRDKIKAKKGMGITLETTLVSICCMGIGITPLNIGELSYAAIPVLLATYQQKEKYQIDIDSVLAGADSKKVKPEYWIRNLKD